MRKNPVIGIWCGTLAIARKEFSEMWRNSPGIRDSEPTTTIQFAAYEASQIGDNQWPPDGETQDESELPRGRQKTVDTTETIETTETRIIPEWRERRYTGKKTKSGKPAFKWIVHKARKVIERVTKTVTRSVVFEEPTRLMFRIIAREWSESPKGSPPMRGPIKLSVDEMGAFGANFENIEDGDLE